MIKLTYILHFLAKIAQNKKCANHQITCILRGARGVCTGGEFSLIFSLYIFRKFKNRKPRKKKVQKCSGENFAFFSCFFIDFYHCFDKHMYVYRL